MGRKEKLRERFLSCPSDFRWDELKRFLEGFGYSVKKGTGSRRKFVGENLPKISLHEPHPKPFVKRCYLEQVKQLLEDEGLL
ncbi:type II toxin-antitoxin system HicA family toxin [Aliiroseovarius marinus]|uniref:type II toxin-antitoxin system HicA family toxin n=1 Tax=Aliiroseovarius marinus TaxID=2500159 RepID=UPI003CD0DCEF